MMNPRLDSKFREELRHMSPKTALLTHLLDYWTSEIKPNLDDISTLGKEVKVVGNNTEDYIIIHDDGVVLIGQFVYCHYGPFNGFSSGPLTPRQLSIGIDVLNNPRIIQLMNQQDKKNKKRVIATTLPIDSINVVTRTIISGDYSFPISNVEIDQDSKTFIVKTLKSRDNKLYQDYQLIENIIPKEIIIDESHDRLSSVDSGELQDSTDGIGDDLTEDTHSED